MKIFTLTVRLTVDEDADAHLQTIYAIADEVKAWLEGLDAEVETITVAEEVQS